MPTHTCLAHQMNDARLTIQEDVLESHEDTLDRLLRRLSRRVGQIQCGITGHNVMLRYAPARLSLQCTSCGYESPGWELEPPRASRSPQPARLTASIAV
jgi:hypothetical protein